MGMMFHMTKTYDIEETLPLSVPVPEWPARATNVAVLTSLGTLDVCAMGVDDIYIEGTLSYRGKSYQVRYAHTNNAGEVKGYYYPDNDDPNRPQGGGQAYGVIPADKDYARRDVFAPQAPPTYLRSLLGCVQAAAITYQLKHADHAAEARKAAVIQDVNRAATEYNRKAKEAAEALDAYEAAQAALEAL